MKKLVALGFLGLITSLMIGCDKNDSNNIVAPADPRIAEEACRMHIGDTVRYDECLQLYASNTVPVALHTWYSADLKVEDKGKYEDLLFRNGNCITGAGCGGINNSLKVFFTANSLEPTAFGTVRIDPSPDSYFTFGINLSFHPIAYGSHEFQLGFGGSAVTFDQGHIQLIIRHSVFAAESLPVDIKYQGTIIATGTVNYCAGNQFTCRVY